VFVAAGGAVAVEVEVEVVGVIVDLRRSAPRRVARTASCPLVGR
jgi:hypothetical protein